MNKNTVKKNLKHRVKKSVKINNQHYGGGGNKTKSVFSRMAGLFRKKTDTEGSQQAYYDLTGTQHHSDTSNRDRQVRNSAMIAYFTSNKNKEDYGKKNSLLKSK